MVCRMVCGDMVCVVKIAEIVGYAPIRVYEVATFYSMFNRQAVSVGVVRYCCVLLRMAERRVDVGIVSGRSGWGMVGERGWQGWCMGRWV